MSRIPGEGSAITEPVCSISASQVKVRGKKKHKQNDPLASLLGTASKAKLVDLLVRVASTRPAVRRECLEYLNRHTSQSPSRKKHSEGERLLALWSELAPDLDDLDTYGGGDYDADIQVSSLLQEMRDFALKVKQDNIKRPAFQEEFAKAVPGWQVGRLAGIEITLPHSFRYRGRQRYQPRQPASPRHSWLKDNT